MKPFMLVILIVLCQDARASSRKHSQALHRSLAQCAWNGTIVQLLDTGTTALTSMDDVSVQGGYISDIDNGAALLTFSRGDHILLKKRIEDMSNPNGWAALSEDRHWMSLNSSNGGAAGGWIVSIFHLESDGTLRDLSQAMSHVERDFSSRHNCQTRGNNYEAFQWRSSDQLLVTASVYGTSDCGKEMGYTEGYVLEPSTGKILKHYSVPELLLLPGVCLWNWDTLR